MVNGCAIDSSAIGQRCVELMAGESIRLDDERRQMVYGRKSVAQKMHSSPSSPSFLCLFLFLFYSILFFLLLFEKEND